MNLKRNIIVLTLTVTIMLSATQTKADFTFGEPTNLGPPVNTVYSDSVGSISTDGLMLYFVSDRPGGSGTDDVWVATRTTKNDPWGPPVNLGPTVNSPARDQIPCVSSDGLELYFASNRSGDWDMWVARRTTKHTDWDIAVNLGPSVNSSAYDHGPWLSADGLELYFDSGRSSAGEIGDIWVARRATRDDPWGTPVKIGPEINSSFEEIMPCLSADGRSLFFSDFWHASLRRPGFGGADMYVSRRATVYDPWGPPMNLGPTVNSAAHDEPVRISPDGSTLYFSSTRAGGYGGQWGDIYEATIIPVVDFNGDGIVDAADMCIMIDHWGENYSLCDIGPTPLGDGIVDVQDLIVLAEHLFEDFRLIAHWKLDEGEGSIAYDSIQGHDGTCYGEPLWVPAGGKIDGALQFDGINDFITTDFELNPGKVSFSATTWIRGGTMDQVIISQADVDLQGPIDLGSPWNTWLGINSSDGRLMTGLMVIVFGPLESESLITDGQWHHVGLVYDRDNLCRFLYVDGVEDARDIAPVAPIPSEGGLFFGVGQNFDVKTFFSGLIDDVRIYNVALSAEEIAALAQ